VVSESSGPVASGTTAKGQASASAGPALAAVSVSRPCGSTDIRLKQGSESSGLGATSSPRGAGRGPPAAAASRPSASAGAPHGPAPWQQAGYKHPGRHTVFAPPKGEKFHRSVNANVRVDPRRNGHKNYLGHYMEKKYTEDLEHAVNKCIRHSEFLTMSDDGWSYLTDVGYIIWKNPGLYYQISRHHKPTEAEMMYAIEVSSSREDRFQVSAL
jgi:hypothetical protein